MQTIVNAMKFHFVGHTCKHVWLLTYLVFQSMTPTLLSKTKRIRMMIALCEKGGDHPLSLRTSARSSLIAISDTRQLRRSRPIMRWFIVVRQIHSRKKRIPSGIKLPGNRDSVPQPPRGKKVMGAKPEVIFPSPLWFSQSIPVLINETNTCTHTCWDNTSWVLIPFKTSEP